ncbi:septation protein SepH [Microtetraspora niveoalba]|uniref:septation protein SepH n=1 Tax=Microtetraspora niveoalba TaxID=46175 RepID=UPI000AF7B004|nr:septation protein SepH [Microtetraspora niveoalba]
MQELRLVAVSEDGTYLVLATAGRGTRFTLPVDDRLRAAVRGNFSRLGQYEIEVESPLRPKEIQARIRAGESAEEIAATAGIPVERVRWFEGPVLQEREYMAQQAQRVAVRLPGETTPGPTLGELVAERLTRRGVPADEIDWDSCKRDDNLWRVKLGFVWNGHTRHAEWLFDPRRRHITPNDDEAMRLSAAEYVEPVAREDTTVRPFLPRLASKLAPVPPLPDGSLSIRAGRPEPDFPSVRPEPARRDEPVHEEPAARTAAETAYLPEAPFVAGTSVVRPEPGRETAFHLRQPVQGQPVRPEAETPAPVRMAGPAPIHGGAPPPSAPDDVARGAASPAFPGDAPGEPAGSATPHAEERLSLVQESAAPQHTGAEGGLTAAPPEAAHTDDGSREHADGGTTGDTGVEADATGVSSPDAATPTDVQAVDPVTAAPVTAAPVTADVVTADVVTAPEEGAAAPPTAQDDARDTAADAVRNTAADATSEPGDGTRPAIEETTEIATPVTPAATSASEAAEAPASDGTRQDAPVTSAPTASAPGDAPDVAGGERRTGSAADPTSEPVAAPAASTPEPAPASAPAASTPEPTPASAPAASMPEPAAASAASAPEPAAAPAVEPVPEKAPEPVAVPAARVSEERAAPAASAPTAAPSVAPTAAPAAAPGKGTGREGAAKEPKPEPPAPPTPKPAPARPRKSRGRRASVPTWDEIMFGARKQE